jgi:hypothetical protein
VVVAIKALARELPATSGRPLSRWQCPDLARAAVEQGIVASISGTTVWRWLSRDAIKPWQHRSWIFPRDPDFAVKTGRILDLYTRRWENEPLEDDEYVISTDEKTSIQARCRCHPTLAPTSRQPMRVEHEYHRKGALAYLAALDVHHARVLGLHRPDVQSLAHRQAAAPAHPRIVAQPDRDLLLDHPTQSPGPQRLHALDAVADRIIAFQDYWQATGTPFDWKFTRTDLNHLLARITTHEPLAAAA